MNLLPALCLAVFTAAFLVAAYGYPPQARAFPAAVGWVTMALIALDVRKRLAPKIATAEVSSSLRAPLVVALWLAGFAVALVLFGVLYAVPLYIFASLRFRGHRSWVACVLVSFIVTGGIWALFSLLLRLDLYPGYFFA